MRIASNHFNIERRQNSSDGRDRRTRLLYDLWLWHCMVMRSRLGRGWCLLPRHSRRRNGRRWRPRFRLFLNQLLIWKPEIAIMVKHCYQCDYQHDESGHHQALLFYGIRVGRSALRQITNRRKLLGVGHNDPH